MSRHLNYPCMFMGISKVDAYSLTISLLLRRFLNNSKGCVGLYKIVRTIRREFRPSFKNVRRSLQENNAILHVVLSFNVEIWFINLSLI